MSGSGCGWGGWGVAEVVERHVEHVAEDADAPGAEFAEERPEDARAVALEPTLGGEPRDGLHRGGADSEGFDPGPALGDEPLVLDGTVEQSASGCREPVGERAECARRDPCRR